VDAATRGKALGQLVISSFDHVDNPHYGGGGAVVVAELAARLARSFDVTVVTAGSHRRPCGRAQGAADGVRWVFLPVGWAGPRGGQLLFHAMLPLVAMVARYDVWLESFTPPFSTSFLPLVTRRPVVGLAQMLAGRETSRRYHLPFWRVERLGLRLYRHVVTLNDADAETVAADHPGVSVTRMTNGVRLPPEPARYGEGSCVLYLGRIDVDVKGLDLLVQAHARSHHPLPLVIAGHGTRADEARLRRLLADHPAPPVQVVGTVVGAEKEQLLRDCAFLVLPSRSETFGLAALEAMSYGKPVVAFDLPQTRWIPTDAGVRVPAFAVDRLAAAMDGLVDDPQARARLGRAGRRAAAGYDWDAIALRYEHLVREVLHDGR